MVDLDAVEIRSYIAEPERGRRDWSKAPRPKRRCMATAAGFAAPADGG
jgi:hypothetical protein